MNIHNPERAISYWLLIPEIHFDQQKSQNELREDSYKLVFSG
jgi:hypothetical protein